MQRSFVLSWALSLCSVFLVVATLIAVVYGQERSVMLVVSAGEYDIRPLSASSPIEGDWLGIQEHRSHDSMRCTIFEAAALRYVRDGALYYPELSSNDNEWSYRDFIFAVSGLELMPGSFECVRPEESTWERVSTPGRDGPIVRRAVREAYRLADSELVVMSRIVDERMEIALGNGIHEQVLEREEPEALLLSEHLRGFSVNLAGDLNRDGALDALITINMMAEAGRYVLVMSTPDAPDGLPRQVAQASY